MLPVLLDLKFIKIYTFGVFLVLAFFWSSFLLWKHVRLTQYKEEDIFDGVFLSIAGGLFVGRLVHVALNFDKFGFSLLKFILINGFPGISLYGFIAGFLLVFYLSLRSKKIIFREVVDYIVPPAFIALALGKVGSFFGGVEVGAVTKFPISVRYGFVEGARHPTSFYEGLLFAVSAALSLRLLFALRRDRFEHGFNFYFFLWFFAFTQVILDPLKSYHLRLFRESFNFLVSSVLLLTFSLYFLYYFRSRIFSGLLYLPKTLYGKLFNKRLSHKAKEQTGGGAGEDTL